MRAYRLLQVALQAEMLRWRSMAARMAVRAAFACVALLFLVGALTFAHVAGWAWLRLNQGFNEYATAGILGGVDLVIAIVFLVLAGRSGPGTTEREALEVRRRALHSVGNALSLGSMLIPVLRLANTMMRRARRR
jgi:hypothetical protein